MANTETGYYYDSETGKVYTKTYGAGVSGKYKQTGYKIDSRTSNSNQQALAQLQAQLAQDEAKAREQERANQAEQARVEREQQRQAELQQAREQQEILRQEQEQRNKISAGIVQGLSREENIEIARDEGYIKRYEGESVEAYTERLAKRGEAKSSFAPKSSKEYLLERAEYNQAKAEYDKFIKEYPEQAPPSGKTFTTGKIDTATKVYTGIQTDIPKELDYSYTSEIGDYGSYVRPSKTGMKGTLEIRPPTQKELKSIEAQQKDLATANLKLLEKKYDKIMSGEIADETVTVGVGKFSYEKPISELSFPSQKSELKTIAEISGLMTGAVIGKGFEKILPEQGLFQTISKEEKVSMVLPYQEKGTLFYGGEEYYVPKTDIIIPAKRTKYFSSKQGLAFGKGIGKATSLGIEISPFFIPVVSDAYLFVYKPLRISSFLEEGYKEGLPMKTALKQAVYKEFKTDPIGTALMFGIPTYRFLKGSASKLKLTKESKYLSNPELKVNLLESKQVTNVMKEPVKRFSLRADKFDDFYVGGKLGLTDDVLRIDIKTRTPRDLLIDLSQKTKGTTTLKEIYNLDDALGKTIELRDVGLIKAEYIKGESFLKSKIRIGKSMKEFTGTTSVVDDIYRETIPYGKNIVKETKINVKTGEGTVKLFDKGELKISKQFQTNVDDLLKGARTKVKKYPFEENVFDTKQITELEVNKKLLKRQIVDAKGNLVLMADDTIPNLESVKGKGTREFRLKKKLDFNTGEFAIKKESYSYADIIKSKPRKALFQKTDDALNLVAKKRVGQEIVYGTDKDIDTIIRLSEKGKTGMLKKISPKGEREIFESSGTKTITGYINPKSTSFKDLLKKRNEYIKNLNKAFKRPEEITQKIQKIKKIKQIKAEKELLKDISTPSYVGGAGGEGSLSLFAQKSKLDLPSKIYFEEPTQYLKGFKASSTPALSTTPKIMEKSIFNIPRISYGIKEKSLMEIQTKQPQMIKSIQKESLLTKSLLDQVNLNKLYQTPIMEQRIKTQLREKQIVKQQQKQEQELMQLQVQKSAQRQAQRMGAGYGYGYGFTPRYTPRPPTGVGGGLPFMRTKKLSPLKQARTYDVLIKSRGRFTPRGKGLTRAEALLLGSNITRKELARTFRIRPTGKTKDVFRSDETVIPDERIFRQYKVRRGKKIYEPRTYIQRTSANLQNLAEQSALRKAKLLKGIPN